MILGLTHGLSGTRSNARALGRSLLDGFGSSSGSSATATRAPSSRFVLGDLSLALATSSALDGLGSRGARRGKRRSAALLGWRGGTERLVRHHCSRDVLLVLVSALLLLNTVTVTLVRDLVTGSVVQTNHGLDFFNLQDLWDNWATVHRLFVAQHVEQVGPDVGDGDVVDVVPSQVTFVSVDFDPERR